MTIRSRDGQSSLNGGLKPTSSSERSDSSSSSMADRFLPSTFSHALTTKNGHRMPQAIAHRGFKARYPENTMISFQGAMDAGAHALETDIHVTRDNIAVISHDPNLKRCYGVDKKVIDCDWEYLRTLRTVKDSQPMPRLRNVLDLLAKPENTHLWLLLDIKTTNDADTVMRLIAQDIAETPAPQDRPWETRIVMGIWASRFLPHCAKHTPDFPVSFITMSPSLATTFLKVPNISFNMNFFTLQGPMGRYLISQCRKLSRPIYSWTVNKESHMRWCINRKLDGVVTDDPALFLQVCDDVESKGREKSREAFGWRGWAWIVTVHGLLMFFLPYLMRQRGIGIRIDKRFTKTR